MKKKNISLAITVLFMFMMIVVSTYAYFSSTVSNSAYAVVNTTLPGAVATFTTEKTDVAVSISASQMQNASASTTAKSTATGTIKAKLLSSDNSSIKCTYNIRFKWNTSTYYTNSTGGVIKEFTYQVDNSCAVGSGSCPTGSAGITTAETQLPNLGSSVLNLGNATIYSSNTTTYSIQTHTVTLRFYNLANVNQDAQKGKVFSGKVYIDNVVC